MITEKENDEKNKKFLKNVGFILWYMIYLRMGYLLFTQQGYDDNAQTGIISAIYPLSIFHLESLRREGKLFGFRGRNWANLSTLQRWFVILTVGVSVIVFWILTGTYVLNLLMTGEF
jgi:hypothetical protein